MINELFDVLADLRDEGITILLVDQMAVLALGDRRPWLCHRLRKNRARR